jgi:hypothetical protein
VLGTTPPPVVGDSPPPVVGDTPPTCNDIQPGLVQDQPWICDTQSGWFPNQTAANEINPSNEVCCLVSCRVSCLALAAVPLLSQQDCSPVLAACYLRMLEQGVRPCLGMIWLQ